MFDATIKYPKDCAQLVFGFKNRLPGLIRSNRTRSGLAIALQRFADDKPADCTRQITSLEVAELTEKLPDKNADETPAKNYEVLDPDVRLMLQVREGNAGAFEDLMRRYQNRLVAVLQHLVPGTQQAEDLAQEVFMRVYRARKSYTPGAKFSTWLFTIANNVASNALRKLARTREVHLQSTPSGSVAIRPLENMAKEASGLMPTRVLDRSEESEVVIAAIQSLNERQRMAVLLSKFEHMSYVDIAETMGMTTQAVKSLLSRARGNLKDILMPYMQNGTPLTPIDEQSTVHKKTSNAKKTAKDNDSTKQTNQK